MLIDTHCHLSCDDYNNLDDIINEFDGIMIASGCDLKTNKEVIELVNKYDNVYGTLGIHPEEIENFKESDLKFIEDNLNNTKIVGIGEIGLDYYWVKDNKEQQKELFIKQLDMATRLSKPVVIHTREATKDTLDILKSYNLRGDIHCFSGSLEIAREYISLGYKLGIGGVLTFKNSKLPVVLESLPIESILLETDSPYLAPEPVRGSKNESSNIPYIAKKIADIKKLSTEEVEKITTNNAIALFDLDI